LSLGYRVLGPGPCGLSGGLGGPGQHNDSPGATVGSRWDFPPRPQWWAEHTGRPVVVPRTWDSRPFLPWPPLACCGFRSLYICADLNGFVLAINCHVPGFYDRLLRMRSLPRFKPKLWSGKLYVRLMGLSSLSGLCAPFGVPAFLHAT